MARKARFLAIAGFDGNAILKISLPAEAAYVPAVPLIYTAVQRYCFTNCVMASWAG
ncbi:hypothetical protein HORIV_20050 [Vreelandella olivaria]|uniref:Uncharacterized protein n=1 Tax=Vreelandella olivaria TaxID=390919 RepID=A0ABM7GGR1_9GAMM|nr:hypothetical protein HORIV_20050 [Halomonas olivaria]